MKSATLTATRGERNYRLQVSEQPARVCEIKYWIGDSLAWVDNFRCLPWDETHALLGTAIGRLRRSSRSDSETLALFEFQLFQLNTEATP